MLVLTRKHQEKIQIGDDIVITVLKTKGKTVRLGIEAPNNVTVLRGELTFDLPRPGDESESSKPATEAAVTGSKVMQARVSRNESSRVIPALIAGQAPLKQFLASSQSASVS